MTSLLEDSMSIEAALILIGLGFFFWGLGNFFRGLAHLSDHERHATGKFKKHE